MKKLIILLIFTLPIVLLGQSSMEKISGVYSDELAGIFTTQLKLLNDATFELNTVDPEFPYNFKSFQNSGDYITIDKGVILNPNLKPREIEVGINGKKISTNNDSVQFKINYLVSYFQNNKIDTTNQFEFETLTILINKKKNAKHLTREPISSKCAFRKKVKNQIIIDKDNLINLPREKIEKIGIFSYGFKNIIWIDIDNKSWNFFEVNVHHPIDRERMPRSKEVIIKRKKAYYYETDGKVDKSLIPLKKISSR